MLGPKTLSSNHAELLSQLQHENQKLVTLLNQRDERISDLNLTVEAACAESKYEIEKCEKRVKELNSKLEFKVRCSLNERNQTDSNTLIVES
jgi:hypothetical protein